MAETSVKGHECTFLQLFTFLTLPVTSYLTIFITLIYAMEAVLMLSLVLRFTMNELNQLLAACYLAFTPCLFY